MRRVFRQPPRKPRRAGLTLLEVIIALAIFLFSLVALNHLLSLSGQQVLEASWRSEATQRCQSKLSEVVAGAQSTSSSGWSSFTDDPDWEWQLNSTQGDVPNLWNVQVTVRHKRGNGTYAETSLSQMVVAPNYRGSTLVNPAANSPNSNNNNNNNNGNNNNGSPGNSGNPSGNMGGSGP